MKSPTGANTVKVEVSEDVLAALLEAARRNGDADSLDEAVRLLQVIELRELRAYRFQKYPFKNTNLSLFRTPVSLSRSLALSLSLCP